MVLVSYPLKLHLIQQSRDFLNPHVQYVTSLFLSFLFFMYSFYAMNWISFVLFSNAFKMSVKVVLLMLLYKHFKALEKEKMSIK